jgi:hypothetical protein
MSFATDIQGDYSIIDGIERVTVRNPAEEVTCTHVAAKRSNIGMLELSAAGYEANDIAWRLWASTCKVSPRQGDTIRENDGTVWTILSIRPSMMGRVVINYRCVCRKQL